MRRVIGSLKRIKHSWAVEAAALAVEAVEEGGSDLAKPWERARPSTAPPRRPTRPRLYRLRRLCLGLGRRRLGVGLV